MAEGSYPFDFRSIVGMDPAANWLLGSALADYLLDANNFEDLDDPKDPDQTPIPFLYEFRSDEAVEAFNRLGPLNPEDEANRESNGVLILAASERDLKGGSIAAAVASLQWFQRLLDGSPASEDVRTSDKRIVLSSPVVLPPDLLRNFPDFPRRWIPSGDSDGNFEPPPGGWPASTVFMGVIDDGMAIAHERLRRANGDSRVEAYWNMNVPFTAALNTAFPGPPGSLPGELVRADIEARFTDSDLGGVIEEERFYRLTGVVDHTNARHKAVAWRIAHGAHVLDVAAGAEPVPDVPDRPIIAVQLPTPVVARTIGDWMLDIYIALGIFYVQRRAEQLAGTGNSPPRLVINTSFGYIAGPHDGSGPLERFMDGLVTQRDPFTQITLPAGNAHLSRCHAEINPTAGNPVVLDWMVQPNDRTHSTVQVWLPLAHSANRITMTVTAPDGNVCTIGEAPGAIDMMTDSSGRITGVLYLTTHFGRHVLNLWIMPTDRAQPTPRVVAPAGRWELRFDATNDPLHEAAHAWVQRDDSLYGYPQRGRQAYFDRPDYVRFDAYGREVYDDSNPAPSPINRRGLFNAIATGARVLSAGGYFERTYDVAPYSAGGPSTPPEAPPLTKPDALLPSEGSWALSGVLAAGSRSGARVRMSGTSVASPQLARLVADRMAANLPVDRVSIETLALAADPLVPPAPPRPPNRGAGRLPRPDPLPVPR